MNQARIILIGPVNQARVTCICVGDRVESEFFGIRGRRDNAPARMTASESFISAYPTLSIPKPFHIKPGGACVTLHVSLRPLPLFLLSESHSVAISFAHANAAGCVACLGARRGNEPQPRDIPGTRPGCVRGGAAAGGGRGKKNHRFHRFHRNKKSQVAFRPPQSAALALRNACAEAR